MIDPLPSSCPNTAFLASPLQRDENGGDVTECRCTCLSLPRITSHHQLYHVTMIPPTTSTHALLANPPRLVRCSGFYLRPTRPPPGEISPHDTQSTQRTPQVTSYRVSRMKNMESRFSMLYALYIPAKRSPNDFRVHPWDPDQ